MTEEVVDSVSDCLTKRDLNVGQAKRMILIARERKDRKNGKVKSEE